MKIFVVEANYSAHNKQDNSSFVKSEEPVFFMKPDSALLKDNKPFFIPDFSKKIVYGAQIVIRINKLGKNIGERFAHRYYDAVTVGLDLTARDLQEKLIQQGQPWEVAKGFDGSAVLGRFIPKEQMGDLNKLDFRLMVDGKQEQQGCSENWIFSVDRLIAWISQFYTLKMGDLLFTGAPVGDTIATVNQHLQGYLQDQPLFDFHIR